MITSRWAGRSLSSLVKMFFSADMDEDDGLGLVWKSSEY